jgi:hypothetical protein
VNAGELLVRPCSGLPGSSSHRAKASRYDPAWNRNQFTKPARTRQQDLTSSDPFICYQAARLLDKLLVLPTLEVCPPSLEVAPTCLIAF